MNADEEYLRDRWERIALEWGTLERKRYVCVSAGGMFIPLQGFKTEAEAWSAARAFTEQREREIAEVREEISEIEDDILSYSSHDNADSFAVIYRRILARLQARLAELRRGMQEGSE